MNRILAFLCIIVSFLLAVGCTSKDASIQQTPNAALNSLLNKAPATILNLRDKPLDSLFATSQNVLGDKAADSVAAPAAFGRIVSLIKANNKLYAADQKRHCIWILNESKVIGKIGQKGRGPGEFGILSGIIENSNSIFTIDKSNGRIQKYDQQFDLLDTYYHVIHGNALTGNESITATDSLLYMPSGAFSHKKLIEIHQTTSYDSVQAVLPRLIPPDKQPSYNRFLIDGNREGRVAVAYFGLPYIFIYSKNSKLQHVIVLKFPDAVETDNPSVAPVVSKKPIGVASLLNNLQITNDNNIYFFAGRYFYQLAPNGEGGSYNVQKVRYFTHEEPDKRKEKSDGLISTTMTVADDTLYFTNIYYRYIYKFSLK